MSEIFYVDNKKDIKISYGDLLHSVNSDAAFMPYYKAQNEEDFYYNFIKGILSQKEITLLDLDFSTDEVSNLIGSLDLLEVREKVNEKFETITALLKAISTSDAKISLFTSGTTGQPKKITHTVGHFIQSVRISDNHKDNRWAFAYNPTHMAGLQVFFQAILNQNTLINVFNQPKKFIIEQIKAENITNISATPTFYRMLLPLDEAYQTVKKITLGGEKSDEKLIENIQKAFPNARVFNIYASTEAGSLFVAKSDAFEIESAFKDKIRIIDNELVLHNSLLGQSELLTSEWYHTGDMVEVVQQTPLTFKFISRKNELINVGGNNVNPSEVEEKILSLSGIQAVRVYGRPNSVMGNLLMAEVVKSNDEITDTAIKEFLRERVQPFKIPRIITFVPHLDVTRTGKVSRK